MFNLKDKEERLNTFKTFLVGGSFIMTLWIVMPFLIHKFVDPRLPSAGLKPVKWLGSLMSAAGYALAVWCVSLFIKVGRGTPLPFPHPKKLVIAGPYRFVRNPMVLGTVLFLLGDAVLLGSVGVLVYAILVFAVMHLFILIEERSLGRRFGQEYSSYLQRTPRWWPRF